MKKIINNTGVETIIYARTVEKEAVSQIIKLCDYPAYQKSKIRIMPDTHVGTSCVIGTTMTIEDKVTPNLVGVDIGCGMLAVKLAETEIDFEKLDKVINQYVPCGPEVHDVPQVNFDSSDLVCRFSVNEKRASQSIGTLGGGNHFIEVGKASDGALYLIIHTGSRKLGLQVCGHYNRLAKYNAKKGLRSARGRLIAKLKAEGRHKEIEGILRALPVDRSDKPLAFLVGQDLKDYLHDMEITQKFAKTNRDCIASIILTRAGLTSVSSFHTIHNYIDFNRMILRKGAVSAEKDEELIIPINMQDGSLLCRGKGNPDWNYSAPHGAGRLMSRTEAKKTISLKEFENSMRDVYSSSVSEGTIDEAPQAYKSMTEIKETVVDTVEVLDTLVSLYNFKADKKEIEF